MQITFDKWLISNMSNLVLLLRLATETRYSSLSRQISNIPLKFVSLIASLVVNIERIGALIVNMRSDELGKKALHPWVHCFKFSRCQCVNNGQYFPYIFCLAYLKLPGKVSAMIGIKLLAGCRWISEYVHSNIIYQVKWTQWVWRRGFGTDLRT